jgi:hypothetical protein
VYLVFIVLDFQNAGREIRKEEDGEKSQAFQDQIDEEGDLL